MNTHTTPEVRQQLRQAINDGSFIIEKVHMLALLDQIDQLVFEVARLRESSYKWQTRFKLKKQEHKDLVRTHTILKHSVKSLKPASTPLKV